jgi:hypothetical protein
MPAICSECGAPLPEGGVCRDYFHELLLLEAQVPNTAGSLLHFYAVASYVLQHPIDFTYTADALAGLRATLAEALDGKLTVADIRRRNRRLDGAARVTRRPGDAIVQWYRGTWPMTVLDVCRVAPDAYAERVVEWARSIRDTLNANWT